MLEGLLQKGKRSNPLKRKNKVKKGKELLRTKKP